MELKRFGVSIPQDLLEDFDRVVNDREYVGRSEAIRDAMRLFISQHEWESGQQKIMASLNIVYSHKPKLMADLIKIQHSSEVHVISTVHIHISRTHCLEVITMSGSKESISRLTNRITGITGVEYARLFTFSLPEEDEDHSHSH